MLPTHAFKTLAAGAALLGCLALGACGDRAPTPQDARESRIEPGNPSESTNPDGITIWDVLRPPNPETTLRVNKYLWSAALDVLDFLPVQAVDPFSGVIATGYGTPPGGTTAYRATIYISDPALDARALRVALQTRAGEAVPAYTLRQVEDAILSRARQLRIADGRY